MELTESLAPMLVGLEVENQAPDFFQRARTELGLFRWTASYVQYEKLWTGQNYERKNAPLN